MIDVFFEVDPHTDATQPPLEPIVFQEGGRVWAVPSRAAGTFIWPARYAHGTTSS